MLKRMKKRMKKSHRLNNVLVTTGLLLGSLMAMAPSSAPVVSAATVQTAQSMPWMNPKQSVDQRVSELLAAMTLDDKIAMMHGSSGSYVGNIPANPRLGIPAINMEDGGEGVGNGQTGVTQLPAPIAMSANWDAKVALQYGTLIGNEDKGKGVTVDLGPNVNIMRTGLNGRTFESYGEDPYLNGATAVQYIKGVQSQGVMADVKHYDANNQETNRTTESSNIDERTLHEIYLPAFEAAVKDGNVASVMASYNKINGQYASENKYLLTDVLKNDWAFKGFVVSDWGATHSTVDAANNGLDIEMPGSEYFGASLKDAVQSGLVSMSTIDDHVSRILRVMFRFGMFDHPNTGSTSNVVTSPEHANVAKNIAEKGTVLLKNDGKILPLNKVRSIAVIGADASTNPMSVGGGSAFVTAPYVVTPLQGIKNRAGSGVSVTYAQGIYPSGALPDIPQQYFDSGLQAQFFNSSDLSGTPVLTRTDNNIDFNWQGNSPGQGVNGTNWSAKWNGTLTPPKTGTYTFSLTSDDGSRLYINGQLVVDNWKYQASTTKTGTINLTAGQPVQVEVDYMQGGGLSNLQLGWQVPSDMTPLEEAVQKAKQSNVAIVFANDYESEGMDRSSYNLPDNQDALIDAVAKVNPNTIVVLNTGGPVLMPWLNKVKGVAEGWYPGQEDGNAIAAVLFGDVNPSGHLPMTFPANAQDVPANPAADLQVNYTEGLNVGYRWYDANHVKPLFPFGYGLSYTTFQYSHLIVDQKDTNGWSDTKNPGEVRVSVDVTNTGSRAGYAVPQLYVGDPSTAKEPTKQLKDFKKVFLKPGETKKVTFTLNPRSFSIWDTQKHNWSLLEGTYKIMVGSSSQDIAVQRKLTIHHVNSGKLTTESALWEPLNK